MSWTLASEEMEGLPESRVAWTERERDVYVMFMSRICSRTTIHAVYMRT
jgi:hypothetical protein